jgi:chromate reductase, NAD(P)H dehydrogenase (quinone)|uniref:NADPH-dependent FMN reductase n=1 Tax=Cephaloticoccus sp. TaxID=1985742 RepID=UPI00404A1868
MSTSPRILAFSGSARRESLNRKFLAVAIRAVEAAGGVVTLVDLNEYTLPLYHGDLEDADGLPANAVKLIDLVQSHAGLLVASPEYNSQVTPLLKNTIDWITRADENPLADKVAAVVSASPGAMGGSRSLQHARQLFLHLGCHVVPAQSILPQAHEAFDEQGGLKSARSQKSVDVLAGQLVDLTKRLG